MCVKKYSDFHTLYEGDQSLRKNAVKNEFKMIFDINIPEISYSNLNFENLPFCRNMGLSVLLADLPASVISIDDKKLR